MAQIVAYVQFATGRGRRELLRETTFSELMTLYSYAVDWVVLQATANAVQIARLFAGNQGTVEQLPADHIGNGVDQLMAANPAV